MGPTHAHPFGIIYRYLSVGLRVVASPPLPCSVSPTLLGPTHLTRGRLQTRADPPHVNYPVLDAPATS